MSLEGLTEAQVKQLATGMQALLNADSAVSLETKRLLKKIDPKLQFPELDIHESIESAVKPLRDENQKLRDELKEKEFTAEVKKQHERIVERGFKVEDVQKFMKDRGIVSFDTAMNVLDMEQRLAAPTPESVSTVYDMPDESKEIFKNPAQWARKTAHQLIDQLKARKRA